MAQKCPEVLTCKAFVDIINLSKQASDQKCV